MTRLSDHVTRHVLPSWFHALMDWEGICATHRHLRPLLLALCFLLTLTALHALRAPVQAGLEHLHPTPVHAVTSRI